MLIQNKYKQADLHHYYLGVIMYTYGLTFTQWLPHNKISLRGQCFEFLRWLEKLSNILESSLNTIFATWLNKRS